MSLVVRKYKGDAVNYKHFEEIIKHFEKLKQPSNEEVSIVRGSRAFKNGSVFRYPRVLTCLMLMARVGSHEDR